MKSPRKLMIGIGMEWLRQVNADSTILEEKKKCICVSSNEGQAMLMQM